MLRVAAPVGPPPEKVALEARWASGRRDSRDAWTAQGLCILPWREGERAVEVTVRAPGQRVVFHIAAKENDGGAHDVALEDDDLAAE